MIARFKVLTPALLLLLSANLLFGSTIKNEAASALIPNAELIYYSHSDVIPAFVRLSASAELNPNEIENWVSSYMNPGQQFELKSYDHFHDEIGMEHDRYHVHINGIPVEFMSVYTHSKANSIQSVNGNIRELPLLNAQAMQTEESALMAAIDATNANQYKWEVTVEEQFIKNETGNPNASYYPKGELVYAPINGDIRKGTYRLSWKFNIYAQEPLSREDIYIDALNGEVVFRHNRIHTVDAPGTAVTGYSGTRDIVADDTGNGFRLRESGRGLGINTLNLNQGTNYGNATDFTDADNVWNNVNNNLDQYATDAHWGAEMTYDYFLQKHNRNSINNAGFALNSYVHYSSNYSNAFWDGQRMTYGDGNNSPLCALDVAGHEIAHGLTNFTANLVYQNESGALNESFSDVFGASIEFFARPNDANWLIGDDLSFTIRSMNNPNALGDPDTYGGQNWYTGSADNGGVHINSGVQNFWYYLLVTGGTGTNDIGTNYSITGIGLDDAGSIAYRNLTTYLNTSSNYNDARFYSIQSAVDLFGACSNQEIQTTNAWNAVGVGSAFEGTANADFEAQLTTSCQAPFTVNFSNLSGGSGTYTWNFGDGNTSNQVNPSHTYSTVGEFDVSLTFDGGACGIQTETKASYIVIDETTTCVVYMPESGGGDVQTSCTGDIYDTGGPNANYPDQTDVSLTISPANASGLSLVFTNFDFETDYDYLYIYDGANVAAPLIGSFTGNNLPNGGVINASGNSLTLRQFSDQAVHGSGFEAHWVCFEPNSPPVSNFVIAGGTSCSGEVNFLDLSQNNPTNWIWHFGDGNTSTDQNPTHTYANDGSYDVSLIVSNAFGDDTEVKLEIAVVDRPQGPEVTGASSCSPSQLELSAYGAGDLNWYDAPQGGTLLFTGSTFQTPLISTTTDYYVEAVSGGIEKVGPVDNTFGGGSNFTNDQHLVFDCFAEVRLNSVLVFATGAGDRIIELRDASGNILQSKTVNVNDGTQRVTLDFDLPVANNLQLGISGTPNLYRNNDGPTYPYDIPGILSIKESSAGTDYYYFFYDWEVSTPSCVSERSMVTAEIEGGLSVQDVSVCDGQSAVFETGSTDGTVRWYDAISGGNLLATGPSYTTDPLTTNTSYFVEKETPAILHRGAPQDNSFGSGGFFTGDRALVFDVLKPVTLNSVKVYANTAGDRTIQLRDLGGNVIQELVATLPAGESRVTLNFTITTGTDYVLGTTPSPDLYRNNGGVNYPYAVGDAINITRSTATTASAFYYYFYDWEVSEPGCVSDRIEVTVTIGSAATITASVSPESIAGSNDGAIDISLSGGTAPFNFEWSNNASAEDISNLSAGDYTVSVTDATGCVASFTATVTSSNVCPQVTGLHTTNITPTTARLDWNGVGGVDHFVIRGRKLGDQNWISVPINNPSATQKAVNGLSNNTSYEWQIQSVCDEFGEFTSAWSALDTFTTGCYEPGHHFTTDITSNSARLIWDAVAGATKYEIRGRAIGSGWVNLLLNSNSTEYFVTTLSPSTTYEWKIRTWCNASGSRKSAFTSLTQFTTPAPSAKMVNSDYSVSIYPNPAKAFVLVNIPQDEVENAELKLFDMQGKLVRNQQIYAAQTRLDLQGLSESIYHIQIEFSNAERVVKKLVIK